FHPDLLISLLQVEVANTITSEGVSEIRWRIHSDGRLTESTGHPQRRYGSYVDGQERPRHPGGLTRLRSAAFEMVGRRIRTDGDSSNTVRKTQPMAVLPPTPPPGEQPGQEGRPPDAPSQQSDPESAPGTGQEPYTLRQLMPDTPGRRSHAGLIVGLVVALAV